MRVHGGLSSQAAPRPCTPSAGHELTLRLNTEESNLNSRQLAPRFKTRLISYSDGPAKKTESISLTLYCVVLKQILYIADYLAPYLYSLHTR